MTLLNKIKWILGILLVFILIIATNLVDRHNFVSVRDAVVTIYEDRLVAKGILLDITRALQEKEVALVKNDTTFFNQSNTKINRAIDVAISQFEQTKLTETESKIFQDLKTNINKLLTAEEKYRNSNYTDNNELLMQIEDVKGNLYGLSKIQLDEGKRQMAMSEKAIKSVELFTQIEIYILILLAIIIQIIVIYTPKKEEEK